MGSNVEGIRDGKEGRGGEGEGGEGRWRGNKKGDGEGGKQPQESVSVLFTDIVKTNTINGVQTNQ